MGGQRGREASPVVHVHVGSTVEGFRADPAHGDGRQVQFRSWRNGNPALRGGEESEPDVDPGPVYQELDGLPEYQPFSATVTRPVPVSWPKGRGRRHGARRLRRRPPTAAPTATAGSGVTVAPRPRAQGRRTARKQQPGMQIVATDGDDIGGVDDRAGGEGQQDGQLTPPPVAVQG